MMGRWKGPVAATTRLASITPAEVSARIAELASRRMRFAYEVRRGADLLATGGSEHYWVEREGRRPVRMPEALREPFARLAGAGPVS